MPDHNAGRARRLVLAAALITMFGCKDSGSTGPTGPSPDFDIAGQWQWKVTNAASGNSKCTVTGVTITFSWAGDILTGHRVSPGGGNFICSINGGPTSLGNYTTNDDLDNLTYNGTSISYTFATTGGTWEMSGSITGDNSMGGTATIRIATTIGPMTLTGPWSATR